MTNSLSLSFDLALSATADGARRFVQRANSGKPFAYAGEAVVIDFDGVRIGERIPALLDHDPTRRAGVIDAYEITENGLELRGYFLDNPSAREVIADADAGFPWQASVRTEAAAVDTIPRGKPVTVNGVEYQGPMTVHRGVTIRESSFVALGADPQTVSIALSESPIYQPEVSAVDEESPDGGAAPAEESTDDMAAIKAQLAEAMARAEAAEKALAEFLSKAREMELSAIGVKGDEAAVLKRLDEPAYQATLKIIKAAKASVSDRLTAEIYASAPKPESEADERKRKIAMVVGGH